MDEVIRVLQSRRGVYFKRIKILYDSSKDFADGTSGKMALLMLEFWRNEDSVWRISSSGSGIRNSCLNVRRWRFCCHYSASFSKAFRAVSPKKDEGESTQQRTVPELELSSFLGSISECHLFQKLYKKTSRKSNAHRFGKSSIFSGTTAWKSFLRQLWINFRMLCYERALAQSYMEKNVFIKSALDWKQSGKFFATMCWAIATVNLISDIARWWPAQ